jgi:MoaA/NifB/PqqE/SkfB family radical SAM enzyme
LDGNALRDRVFCLLDVKTANRHGLFALSKICVPQNAPVETTFFVTSRCNAACSYCFYSKNLNQSANELSPSEIGRLFSSFGPLIRVLISGGEPFLRDDLPQIIHAICKHSNPHHITIPTNGLLTGKITACEDLGTYLVPGAETKIAFIQPSTTVRE